MSFFSLAIDGGGAGTSDVKAEGLEKAPCAHESSVTWSKVLESVLLHVLGGEGEEKKALPGRTVVLISRSSRPT